MIRTQSLWGQAVFIGNRGRRIQKQNNNNITIIIKTERVTDTGRRGSSEVGGGRGGG